MGFMNQSFNLLSLSGLLGLILLTHPPVLAQQPEQVALLPLECAGTNVRQCAGIRKKMARLLKEKLNLQALPATQVDRAVSQRCEEKKKWWTCLEHEANLFALTRMLSAPASLSVRVASLGERQAVKLRWIDARENTITVETVETGPNDLDAWLTALGLLLKKRYPPPAPAQSWIGRWELWTAVGAGAIVITGVALALTLTPKNNDPADYHLRLP